MLGDCSTIELQPQAPFISVRDSSHLVVQSGPNLDLSSCLTFQRAGVSGTLLYTAAFLPLVGIGLNTSSPLVLAICLIMTKVSDHCLPSGKTE